jgi:hypothetical protein
MIEKNFWNNAATLIFERTKWEATEEEIDILANRMFLLEERGLSQLNKRLIEGGRMIWDTFAEHNFGYELITYHPAHVKIYYEPNELDNRILNRPPDFVVKDDDITFWLQMKRLSRTERENRQSKAVEQVKKLAQNIKVHKFFWCRLAEDFISSDVLPLIEFISEVALTSEKNIKYLFPSKDHIKAEITFWDPNKVILEYLTLGGYGDLDIINITGDSRTQITNSLNKASGAFEWNTDNKNINLIVIEMGNGSHYDIDLGEALFGDEKFVYCTNGREFWSRENNGFFNDDDFSSKVAGVIALKRTEHLPLSGYIKTLYINDKFKDNIEKIKSLVGIDKIIHYNELIDDYDEIDRIDEV